MNFGLKRAGALFACGLAVQVGAQLKWENCDDLTSGQLKKTLLVARTSVGSVTGTTVVDGSLKEPVKLAVAPGGDVYIAERGGSIRRWRSGSLTTIARVNVFTGGALPDPKGSNQKSNENGLHGLALDPGFETNRWIYLHYAPQAVSTIRIARFTLNGEALDMASEKILLDIPVQRNSCCHTGGGMEFDREGNLFITVGNNTTNPGANAPDAYLKENDPDADDQGHAGNTNDLRGKILKIRPKPDGSYEVPEGNLFPKGTAKTKPEIWAMGLRNPYSLTVDDVRGWVGWGDVGPDDGMPDSEEWNLFTKPGNAGWPYFVGANRAWRPARNKVASAPSNTSPNNTGLQTLPPAIPATVGYGQSCAVTGPVYYYNGANPSKAKLPPHLHKKWLVTDWWKGNLEVVTMSEDGSSVVSRQALLQQNTFNGPLDIQVGPDGALYVVEYGQQSGGLWFSNNGSTAISRLTYTGSCHPELPGPSSLGRDSRGAKPRIVMAVGPAHLGDWEIPAGYRGLRVDDTQGRRVWSYAADHAGGTRVTPPAHLAGRGILRLQFQR